MHLKNDLYDVYGNVLINKGQEITDTVINSLIKKGEKLPKKLISIKGTPFLKDLDFVFGDSRYAPIFCSSSVRKSITERLEELKFEEPLVLELLQMKDSQIDTYKHVQIIACLAIDIISLLDKPTFDPLLAAHVSFTHDIGKTRIEQDLINKYAALTDSEYEIIKTHPTIGYLLLNYYCGWEGKKYCWTAYEHHEKLDGTGYPRGIMKIDPYAQLITPIDIFDALISDRPYRKTAFTPRLAVDFLVDGVENGQLNKTMVYTLINCLRKHKMYPLSKLRVAKEKREELPLESVYGIRTASNWLKKD